jgi:hypothetical protein
MNKCESAPHGMRQRLNAYQLVYRAKKKPIPMMLLYIYCTKKDQLQKNGQSEKSYRPMCTAGSSVDELSTKRVRRSTFPRMRNLLNLSLIYLVSINTQKKVLGNESKILN